MTVHIVRMWTTQFATAVTATTCPGVCCLYRQFSERRLATLQSGSLSRVATKTHTMSRTQNNIRRQECLLLSAVSNKQLTNRIYCVMLVTPTCDIPLSMTTAVYETPKMALIYTSSRHAARYQRTPVTHCT